MRKKSLIAALVWICASSSVDAQITFEKTGYAEALDKARQQKKVLFIYFYTDWCAPCKQLDAVVFSDSAIKAAINDNYVSLKRNAEKGKGIELSKRYEVSGFPTFLFVDVKGKEIGRIVGTRANNDYVIAIKSQGRNDPGGERIKKLLNTKKPAN